MPTTDIRAGAVLKQAVHRVVGRRQATKHAPGLPLICNRDDGNQQGLEQFNHPFGQLGVYHDHAGGLYPLIERC